MGCGDPPTDAVGSESGPREWRASPLAVGVHPSIRDGCGVNPSDVYELIESTTSVALDGWIGK